MTKEIRDQYYTLRWYAKEIEKRSTEKKVQDLAKDMILQITKLLGEKIASEPSEIPKPKAPVSGKTPLKGKHISLVVGHTAKAGGAYSSYLKQNEYVYNSDLTKRTKAIVESLGGTCSIHFRDVGGVAGAYKAALAHKNLLCVIEYHFNAANGKATGSEVLFADSYDKAGLDELNLAQIVSASMANALSIKNRGAKRLAKGKSERGLQNVSQSTNIACILLETGFGDNDKIDAPAMGKKREALAKSIVDGVIKWKKLDAA